MTSAAKDRARTGNTTDHLWRTSAPSAAMEEPACSRWCPKNCLRRKEGCAASQPIAAGDNDMRGSGSLRCVSAPRSSLTGDSVRSAVVSLSALAGRGAAKFLLWCGSYRDRMTMNNCRVRCVESAVWRQGRLLHAACAACYTYSPNCCGADSRTQTETRADARWVTRLNMNKHKLLLRYVTPLEPGTTTRRGIKVRLRA